jgi:hypothetical protein
MLAGLPLSTCQYANVHVGEQLTSVPKTINTFIPATVNAHLITRRIQSTEKVSFVISLPITAAL